MFSEQPEDLASKTLDDYLSCHSSHRWIYREVTMVKHLPLLIRELRHLRIVNDELSAEVSRLSRIAQY